MSNILIVEDNEIIRGGLVRMAKKVDSSVHIFETGSAKEALEYVNQSHYNSDSYIRDRAYYLWTNNYFDEYEVFY